MLAARLASSSRAKRPTITVPVAFHILRCAETLIWTSSQVETVSDAQLKPTTLKSAHWRTACRQANVSIALAAMLGLITARRAE